MPTEAGRSSLRVTDDVMGTVATIDVRTDTTTSGPNYAADAPRASIARALAWLHEVDARFSPYRAASEVCRVQRGELRISDASTELREIATLCDDLRAQSKGAFDASWSGSFDPTGVVKGWALERASELLAADGFTATAVSAGGDMQLRGGTPDRPWRVGISHPTVPRALCAVVATTRDLAVATSGTTERGRHILDPRSHLHPARLVQVTVVGPSLTLADGYATAAFVLGDEAHAWLTELDGYEGLGIRPDGSAWVTPGWSEFTADTQEEPSRMP